LKANFIKILHKILGRITEILNVIHTGRDIELKTGVL